MTNINNIEKETLIAEEIMLKGNINDFAVNNHISDEFIHLFARMNNKTVHQLDLSNLIIDSVANYEAKGIIDYYNRLNNKENFYLLNYITKYNLKQIPDTKENTQLYEDISDLIVRTNIRLVRKFASRYNSYANKIYDVNDYVSEGIIGLRRALKSYDQNKGEFSTYASEWIKQKMYRFYDNNNLIRIPVHAQEKYRKIREFINEYYTSNLSEPTTEEIIRNVDCTAQNIADMLKLSNFISLDYVYGEDSDTSLGEMIPYNDDSIKKEMDMEDNLEKVRKYICSLDEKYKSKNGVPSQKDIDRIMRQKVVIICRYGLNANYLLKKTDLDINDRDIQIRVLSKLYNLNDEASFLLKEIYDLEPMTLEVLGDKMNLTRERIRQIEKQVFTGIKASVRREQAMDRMNKVIVKKTFN